MRIVSSEQLGPVAPDWSGTVERLTIRPDEPERTVIKHVGNDLALVHQPVVEAAERDKIGEACFSAVSPVLDVVSIDEAFECAAGETAALVARVECPADRGRNGPRPATDAERFALFVLDDCHKTRVAGQSSSGFRGDRGAVLQFATAGMAMLQGLGIHMNDDLLAVAT
jgi:hypothetical protein